jgi:hypothetical protein
MAKELPFFRALNLKALFGKQNTRPSEKTLAPTTSGRLRCILPVQARRSGEENCLRLMCGRLSPSTLHFRSTTALEAEETLEVEFLLQGVGTLKMMGQVTYVTLVSEVRTEGPPSQAGLGTVKPIKSYSGQLELWATPAQQDQIISYLCREHEQRRVTAGI